MKVRKYITAVKLIDATSKEYTAFIKDSISKKRSIVANRGYETQRIQNNKTISEASFACEDIVRNWIANSKVQVLKRIVCYQELIGLYTHTKYLELDALYCIGDTAHPVEVKVSVNHNGRAKGLKQLKKSTEVLSRLFKKVVPILIHVDVLKENTRYVHPSFNSNYLLQKTEQASKHDSDYAFIRLCIDPIFRYGIDNGAVADNTLLIATKAEAIALTAIRKERREAMNNGVLIHDLPAHLATDDLGLRTGVFVSKDSESDNKMAEALKMAFGLIGR